MSKNRCAPSSRAPVRPRNASRATSITGQSQSAELVVVVQLSAVGRFVDPGKRGRLGSPDFWCTKRGFLVLRRARPMMSLPSPHPGTREFNVTGESTSLENTKRNVGSRPHQLRDGSGSKSIATARCRSDGRSRAGLQWHGWGSLYELDWCECVPTRGVAKARQETLQVRCHSTDIVWLRALQDTHIKIVTVVLILAAVWAGHRRDLSSGAQAHQFSVSGTLFKTPAGNSFTDFQQALDAPAGVTRRR